MFLLNFNKYAPLSPFLIFTIQNVPIKWRQMEKIQSEIKKPLQYKMFLLNDLKTIRNCNKYESLQYKMFLLNLILPKLLI